MTTEENKRARIEPAIIAEPASEPESDEDEMGPKGKHVCKMLGKLSAGTVLILRTDGECELVAVKKGERLSVMNKAVGGSVTLVTPSALARRLVPRGNGKRLVVYMNDNGLVEDLPTNDVLYDFVHPSAVFATGILAGNAAFALG